MKLVVSFETNDLGESDFFYDKLKIISEGIEPIEVELYAYK